jgi:hypothetical protein
MFIVIVTKSVQGHEIEVLSRPVRHSATLARGLTPSRLLRPLQVARDDRINDEAASFAGGSGHF